MSEEKKTEYVVFDLDDTLCDTRHRAHLLDGIHYDEHMALIGDDVPKHPTIAILKNFDKNGFNVVVITERMEKYRAETMRWLEKHGVAKHISSLYMKPNNNYDPQAIFKLSVIKNNIPKDDILLYFDDNNTVIEEMINNGIPVLEVH